MFLAWPANYKSAFLADEEPDGMKSFLTKIIWIWIFPNMTSANYEPIKWIGTSIFVGRLGWIRQCKF